MGTTADVLFMEGQQFCGGLSVTHDGSPDSMLFRFLDVLSISTEDVNDERRRTEVEIPNPVFTNGSMRYDEPRSFYSMGRMASWFIAQMAMEDDSLEVIVVDPFGVQIDEERRELARACYLNDVKEEARAEPAVQRIADLVADCSVSPFCDWTYIFRAPETGGLMAFEIWKRGKMLWAGPFHMAADIDQKTFEPDDAEDEIALVEE